MEETEQVKTEIEYQDAAMVRSIWNRNKGCIMAKKDQDKKIALDL